MNKRFVVTSLLLIAAMAAWSIGAIGQPSKSGSQSPSIEGTWRLVSRDLPNGTTQAPPAIVGLLTFQDGYRNFNVMWTDTSGAKSVSISVISTYELDASEYHETNIYYMINNEIDAKGIVYDVSAKSGTSPVKVSNGEFSWKMPLFDEPTITYKGDRLVANGPNFVDHWERVK